jgi:hypothetical protein
VTKTIRKIGMPLAMMAAMILTLPACGGGPEEYWQREQLVEEETLESVKYTETVSAGKLKLKVTQKTQVRETPVERKFLLYEETYADFDWDDAGLVFFSILGGIISVGLYFLVAFVVIDPSDDEKN